MRNVVLLHGAWADGSGWKGVYDILTRDGYNVSIVQEPETSFRDDVEATKRVIAQQDGPPPFLRLTAMAARSQLLSVPVQTNLVVIHVLKEERFMARLPYPDRKTFSQELQNFLAKVPEHLNFDMMSWSQATIESFIRQGEEQYTGLELAPRDRELVILTTAAATKSEYEFIQHGPISEAMGVVPAIREAIHRGEFGSEALSTRDRAIVAFAAAVVIAPFVSDEVFAAAKAELSAREIVETLQVIGFYWSFGRVATVLQVEIEQPHGTAVVQASEKLRDSEHADAPR